VGTLLSKQGHFAVKIIKMLANGMDKSAKDDILNEIKTNALVKHPHCVSLAGVSIGVGPEMAIRIVQEWCEGGDLEDMMRQKPQLLFLRFWTYAKQLASALAYLHLKRVVHLDIKPANVLLTKGYASCKFCDFGMGKQLTAAQDLQMQKGRGSFFYMAPELFQLRYGDSLIVDMHQGTYRKPDIYSLAILFLQMFRPQLHRNRAVNSHKRDPKDFMIFDQYSVIPSQVGKDLRPPLCLRPRIYNQVCRRSLRGMRLDCNGRMAFVCGCCLCVLNMSSALRMTPVLSFFVPSNVKVAANGRIATIPLAVKY
jgi:serine/threonine protein kinase